MSRRSLDPVELTGQRFINYETVHVRSLDHRFTIRRDLPDGEWALVRAEPDHRPSPNDARRLLPLPALKFEGALYGRGWDDPESEIYKRNEATLREKLGEDKL